MGSKFTLLLRIWGTGSLVLATSFHLTGLLGRVDTDRGVLLVIQAIAAFAWADIREMKARTGVLP